MVGMVFGLWFFGKIDLFCSSFNLLLWVVGSILLSDFAPRVKGVVYSLGLIEWFVI